MTPHSVATLLIAVTASASVAHANIVIDPFTTTYSSPNPTTSTSDNLRRIQDAPTGMAFANRGFVVTKSNQTPTQLQRYSAVAVDPGAVRMGVTARLNGSVSTPAAAQDVQLYYFNQNCQFDGTGMNFANGTYSSLEGVTAFQFNVSQRFPGLGGGSSTIKYCIEIGTATGTFRSNGGLANLDRTGLFSYDVSGVTGADWTRVTHVSLQINFRANNADSNITVDSFTAVGAVPAPGAIALLGLAGLAGRRRR